MTTQHPLALTGRIAVVTGAASGMGAAIAERLAADGASVALLARRTERLDDLALRIKAEGGEAFGISVDVTDQSSVDRGAEEVRRRFGRVDLVVNAAGVMLGAPIQEGRIDDWTKMIDTNLTGALRLAGAFIGDLVEAAAEGRTADLVNISSVGSRGAYPTHGVYSATKAALTQFSEAIRADLSPADVRVASVEPGMTATELGANLSPEQLKLLGSTFAGIPPLMPADIADVVAFIVSRRRELNLSYLIAVPTRQV